MLWMVQLGWNLSSFAQSSWVQPMVGTDGHGHTFPGAVLPFGMMQLSPDTRIDGTAAVGIIIRIRCFMVFRIPI